MWSKRLACFTLGSVHRGPRPRWSAMKLGHFWGETCILMRRILINHWIWGYPMLNGPFLELNHPFWVVNNFAQHHFHVLIVHMKVVRTHYSPMQLHHVAASAKCDAQCIWSSLPMMNFPNSTDGGWSFIAQLPSCRTQNIGVCVSTETVPFSTCVTWMLELFPSSTRLLCF